MIGFAMRRLRLTAAVLVATSLVLAGCGGDDEPSEDSPEAQEIEGGSTLDSTWPLTGLPVEGDDSSAQTHPVLVTKIDNTASSSPQIGLGEADMVVEELVEGGLTRLAVFYYSQLPDKVGPVRSMRASDIGIVSPVNGSVVTSGAAGQTIARIKHAGITFFQEGAKGVYRDTGRSAPYNVFADLEEIASGIDQDERRPDDYLQWGEAADLPKGQKAASIGASFGGHTTNWQFKGGTYDNLNSYAADGDEFKADTVLVLRVPIGDAGYTDPAGNPVPETKLEGKGDALIFHNGRMVRATWSKNGLEGQLNLSTKAGKISVPAGHTWLELVPAGSQGNVTFK
jgi:Protein of unknown function (DUF3048) N-terminal domain/Protein of unknown function (DUF3048) C-terminal domain